MKQFLQNLWKYLLVIIVGIIIGLIIQIPSCNTNEEHIIEYVERHDTITVEKERIVPKTKIIYVDRIDTCYLTDHGDTVPIQDFPIEHKVYEDTIKTDSTSTEIKIEYSGFNPEINSIWMQHNYFEKQETIIKTKKVGLVWAIGPSLGYSVTINPANGQLNHGISGGITIVLGIGGLVK